MHIIRAMIGHNCPYQYSFYWKKGCRKNTIDKDPITSRIIWLSGLEIGFNRLGKEIQCLDIFIYMEHLMKMKLEPQHLLDV